MIAAALAGIARFVVAYMLGNRGLDSFRSRRKVRNTAPC